MLTICSNQVTLAHFFHKYPWNESHWIISLVTKWWELSKKWNSEVIIRYAFKPKANFFQKKDGNKISPTFYWVFECTSKTKLSLSTKCLYLPLDRKFKLATFYTGKCSMKLFSPKRKTITPDEHSSNFVGGRSGNMKSTPCVASSKFKATTFT